ncbi:unnamed protein product [Peronospora belbahrii]|uniref:Uncharacterized protein n=1 Tax=Peronospora belbahrii TaxID=622444 RepID=A0AAU9KZF8_9STRA|nr:unnamed protein product [Peronospora belbahrii]CAH0521139.1 unnamed protein product [Peronospora belbahrii]
MNQFETISALDPREHQSMTAAPKSTTNKPQSVSSSVANSKGVKRHESNEVEHEDEEQDNGHEGNNKREVNDSLDNVNKLMVNFDGFGSLCEPFAMPRFNDGDKDVGTVRSAIMCKPLSLNAPSFSLSPTCVSALARDEVVKSDTDFDEPSWTIQEFQEYLGMLELLQDVSSDAEGGEMCLSADCLGQMERLLTSLLPQGA